MTGPQRTSGPWALVDTGVGVEVHAPNPVDSADPEGTHCLTFNDRYLNAADAEYIVDMEHRGREMVREIQRLTEALALSEYHRASDKELLERAWAREAEAGHDLGVVLTDARRIMGELVGLVRSTHQQSARFSCPNGESHVERTCGTCGTRWPCSAIEAAETLPMTLGASLTRPPEEHSEDTPDDM